MVPPTPSRRAARRRSVAAAVSLIVALAAPCDPSVLAAWPDGYAAVIDAIARRGFAGPAGLPQGFDLAVPRPDASGRVRMQYNFAWNDPAFSSLLSPRSVGDPRYSLYLVRDASEWPATVTLPRSSPQYPLAALPWLSVDGEKGDYLRARPEQWDVGVTPYDDSPINPWRRAAAASGLAYDTAQRTTDGFYANNYWVTFDIDPAYLLRPDAEQLPSVATASAPPMVPAGDGRYEVDPAWNRPWSPSAPTPVIEAGDGTVLGSRSELMKYWWASQVLGGRFPFTGIGYSYDWYYQDPERWPTAAAGRRPGMRASLRIRRDGRRPPPPGRSRGRGRGP